MKRNFYYLGFIIILFISGSCRKNELPEELSAKIYDGKINNLKSTLASTSAVYFENHDDDSIERQTVLGGQLTNPYLIPNMQQAYSNLGITNVTVNITNLYVRFKPSDIDQLDVLNSTMETQNLELFDTPVDFLVTYEGDYYQDPSIPEEEITWQYAVVPPNFQFPTGILYETLAQIHIPGDNYTAVETEAERLAAVQNPNNSALSSNTTSRSGRIRPQSAPDCGPGYNWDAILRECVPYEGQPPSPAPDAAVPAGNILVYDTQNQTNRPVRKATIVARRWFKIERGYTDNSGHYQMTKRFKNKVRVNVKFKNSDAEIRGVRGIRLWQMISPIKKTIGVFNGDADKGDISYTFPVFADASSKGRLYWAGATSHNAVQDYREYAVQEGIGQPPTGIHIFMNRYFSGMTPMLHKRFIDDLPHEIIEQMLMPKNLWGSIAGGINALAFVLKHQVDMAVSYRYGTSDELKETMYHELTHAAQYEALGNNWYHQFVDAEVNAVKRTILFDKDYNPYGRSTGPDAAVIALGESWAYYMGHYLADRQYGTSAGCQIEQDGGSLWCNSSGTGHPHLDVLEAFNPNLQSDPFQWIPQGLFHDLRDTSNEIKPNTGPVNDGVSGYTNSQFFNAFQSDIFSLQDYRNKLLLQNGNNQGSQVTSLFSEYNYN
ncbi:hypothetical protein [Daejeonella sp.]|uniref:hypothetical protein n=1 Tax=Daejeonella sp. TaxID=2805397 RepID=UPI0030BE344A